MKIDVKVDILRKNEMLAKEINDKLHALGIKIINLVGSPGSGKTTLLEKIIPYFDPHSVAVIEGDLFTEFDAERINKLNVKTIQLNTLGACHLESYMIEDALKELSLENVKYLFIDNIGNLVCTASYNLGEDIRIVVASVTEGNDKPLKYPAMFKSSSIIVLNKIDLVPYCDFDLDQFDDDCKNISNGKIIHISCKENNNIEKLVTLIK